MALESDFVISFPCLLQQLTKKKRLKIKRFWLWHDATAVNLCTLLPILSQYREMERERENQFSLWLNPKTEQNDKNNEQTKWHFKKPTLLGISAANQLNLTLSLYLNSFIVLAVPGYNHKKPHKHINENNDNKMAWDILTVLIGFCVQIKFYNRHKLAGTWTLFLLRLDTVWVATTTHTHTTKSSTTEFF